MRECISIHIGQAGIQTGEMFVLTSSSFFSCIAVSSPPTPNNHGYNLILK